MLRYVDLYLKYKVSPTERRHSANGSHSDREISIPIQQNCPEVGCSTAWRTTSREETQTQCV